MRCLIACVGRGFRPLLLPTSARAVGRVRLVGDETTKPESFGGKWLVFVLSKAFVSSRGGGCSSRVRRKRFVRWLC